MSDLNARILQILGAPKYQPLEKVGLSKALRLPSSDRRLLRDALDALERDGLIARIRKDHYVLPAVANLATGRLEVHQSGSAHLVNEKPGGADIFIPADKTGTAMHGDKVVAQVRHEGLRQRREGADRMEGRIIRILQRAHETLVGTFRLSAKGRPFMAPDDGRFPHDVSLHAPESGSVLPNPPKPGDKVVVKLDPWNDPYLGPEGEVVEVLGPASAPGVDMLSIVRKYHLPLAFPPEVLQEAERIPETIDPKEITRREDLRSKLVVTIDPDDARDYDDAIHVESLKGGGWRLGVHIADVSHYVQPGSALDREARKRGNSTYLVDRVIPMLPERLSNGICSLKPGVDRLAFTAFVDFTAAGRIKSARFARTVICSAARLSYRQALAILQGASEMPSLPDAMEREEARGQATVVTRPPIPVDPVIAQQVTAAWKLAQLLRENRFADGSLDLDFPEVKVWLDGEGRAVRLEKMHNDISHQLIEECMLVANEVVARELKQRKVPSVYRIHEDPDPDKLQDFRETALTYGLRAGDLTQRKEVQKLLAAMKNTAEEQALKIGFLKSLKRAAYSTDPLGHYGLAKVNYTHFTSPIRRYADLIVHRSLADLTRPPKMAPGQEKIRRAQPASVGQLFEIAAHISATERVSADAEKDSVQLKKMEFLQRQIGSADPQRFAAVVVDVRSYGLFVDLPEANISGLAPVGDLPDDFYVFDPARCTFTGRRTRRIFKVGDTLTVVVARVDVRKRQIDFVLAKPESGGRGAVAPARVSAPAGERGAKKSQSQGRDKLPQSRAPGSGGQRGSGSRPKNESAQQPNKSYGKGAQKVSNDRRQKAGNRGGAQKPQAPRSTGRRRKDSH